MSTPNWPPQVHETHTGLVVLVGDRAYKTKRPVVTPFLDFSTVQLREQACVREVELNSRLAPQAYLGVAHLDGPGRGEREPVIVMRRYPDSARLSQRLTAGTVAGEIAAVATVLARFHSTALRGPEIDGAATVAAVTGRWEANLEEMMPLAGRVFAEADLQRIADLTHRYLAGRAELFAERIEGRRIVDGHADLLADDIFWCEDGPVLLDCLDFDDRLRHVDGIDDAAFLAMDLEYLGHADLAVVFLDEYRRAAADPAPRSLSDFYIAYRAVVRAKVDGIRVEQGHGEVGSDAEGHLRIALNHLDAAIPRLVLVGGGPGTGKTTVSRALAEQIGAEVISTDDVRRELVERGLIAGVVGNVGAGLYAPENVMAVYTEVLERAGRMLARGSSVILDGTWRALGERQRARGLAVAASAETVEIDCVAELSVAQSRIARRTGSTSDATAAIAAALAGNAGGAGESGWAGWSGWEEAHRLDTGRQLTEVIANAVDLCRQPVAD